MRDEWDQRAREDAPYYVAFGRRDQDAEGFFATAADVVRGLEALVTVTEDEFADLGHSGLARIMTAG